MLKSSDSPLKRLDRQTALYFARRAGALSIDYVLLNVLLYGILGVLLGGQLGVTLAFILGAVYQSSFILLNDGQTPGKMLLGLRVVKIDERPITIVDTVVRYLGYYIDTLIIIGWLWAIVDRDKRALHDYMAGTRVIFVGDDSSAE